MNVTIYNGFMLEFGSSSLGVCGNFYMAVSCDGHLYDNFALFGLSQFAFMSHNCCTCMNVAFFLERSGKSESFAIIFSRLSDEYFTLYRCKN